MTLREAFGVISHILNLERIDDAPLEAEILLCQVLEISKTQLYTEPERLLTLVEIKYLQHLVQRRLLHEPTAYILGCCEFYGGNFYVDPRAFIPRPETELLVEKVIEFAQSYLSRNHFTIADIGTGCGAIAVNLSVALPRAIIYATDISEQALEVADINCQRYQTNGRVVLLHGNLLEPLPQPVDVIVANLPYVSSYELSKLSPEIINFEPMIALAGGKDGLDKIHSLVDQIPGKICPGGCLFLEIGQGQDKAVTSLVNSYFPEASTELIPDLSGIDRVVKVIIS